MTHTESAPTIDEPETSTMPAEAPTAEPTLAELVMRKMEHASAPMKLTDLLKGLPKPAKPKAPKKGKGQPRARARQSHQLAGRRQRNFSRGSPFGAGCSSILRAPRKRIAIGLAMRSRCYVKLLPRDAEPMPIAALAKSLKSVVAGSDPAFAEMVVRELIAEGRLFEHPAKTAKAGPRFGSVEPPPPLAVLETGKNKAAMDKIATSLKKLLETAGVGLTEAYLAIRNRLPEFESADEAYDNADAEADFDPPVMVDRETEKVMTAGHHEPSANHSHPPTHHDHAPAQPAPAHASGEEMTELEELEELKELILEELASASVHSIADLRKKMPDEYRGPDFDEAVLTLNDEYRVILYGDANPERYTEEQRAELLTEGESLFTTISKRV